MTALKNRGALTAVALLTLVTLPASIALADAQDADKRSMREQMNAEEVVFVPGITATPIQQFAGAAVTIPAPLPVAPEPVAAQAGDGCPALIEQALGKAGCMISFCESGWNANATGAAGEMGWFQIHPRWHADATYDPAGNVAAAARISAGGRDWSQWTVRTVLSTGVCPGGRVYPN